LLLSTALILHEGASMLRSNYTHCLALFPNDSNLLYSTASPLLIGWMDPFIRRKCGLLVMVTTHTYRTLWLRTIWTVHPLFNIPPCSAHGKNFHCCPLHISIHNFIHLKCSDNVIRAKIYAPSTVIHQCILSRDTNYNYYILSVRNKLRAVDGIFFYFTTTLLFSA
jgi:hypothetical protein